MKDFSPTIVSFLLILASIFFPFKTIAKEKSLPHRLTAWLIESPSKNLVIENTIKDAIGKSPISGATLTIETFSQMILLKRLDLAMKTGSPLPEIIEIPSRFFTYYAKKGWLTDLSRTKAGKPRQRIREIFDRRGFRSIFEKERATNNALARSNSLFATCIVERNGTYGIYGLPLFYNGQPLIINSGLLRRINKEVPEGITLSELLFESWDTLSRTYDQIFLKLVRYQARLVVAKGGKLALSIDFPSDLGDVEKITRFNNDLLAQGIEPMSILGIPSFFDRQDEPYWLFPISFNYGFNLKRDGDVPEFDRKWDNLHRSMASIGWILRRNLSYASGCPGSLIPLEQKLFNNTILAIFPKKLDILLDSRWNSSFFPTLPPRGISSERILRNYLYLNGSNIAVLSGSEKADEATVVIENIFGRKQDERDVIEKTGYLPAESLYLEPWKHSGGLVEFIDLIERNGRYFGHEDIWPAAELGFEEGIRQLLKEIIDLDLDRQEIGRFSRHLLENYYQQGRLQ